MSRQEENRNKSCFSKIAYQNNEKKEKRSNKVKQGQPEIKTDNL